MRTNRIIRTIAFFAILSFTVCAYAQKSAQKITVSGTVTDASNDMPLIGVAILVDGTTNGTVTDLDGRYSITANRGDKLLFFYMGYKTKEVSITEKTKTLNVKLKPDKVVLEEVMINRYGSDKKVPTVAGSVKKVDSKDVQEKPVANMMDALQGKVAGLQIYTSSKEPSEASSLRLHGVGSLAANNAPLYIVDGKPATPKEVAKLRQNEIKSVSVLKDASATSIYGSRAANGAVVINSKEKNVNLPIQFIAPITVPDAEAYSQYVENSFLMAQQDPLSTFSIDVDVASYSNFRRFVNQGQLPPKDAIRIEEFINYFSYNYVEPQGKTPVALTTEVGECPWNKQHRLVRVGVKAKELAEENMPASNFVFLIDVSGSMSGATRLGLVKSSMKLLVKGLRKKDRVAIVTYANGTRIALPSTSGADKQKIHEVLDGLGAGGGTAGSDGLMRAYKVAKENFIKGGNNRIVLCTDGDFNIGPSSDQELEDLITNERQSGVFLSVLGYGMGNYKDSKMQTLAQKGNGNAAYIDNLQEANKVLVNEFGATMYTVAKDVKLQVEFNPAKVQAYRLVGYESRLLNKEDFNDDTKDAGEMGAGHTVTAFYEVIPVGVESNISPLVDDLKYQKNTTDIKSVRLTDSPELLTVKLRYKLPDASTSSKIELPLIDYGANSVSDDFKFASAVAMFGQLLKGSSYKGTATFNDVLSLAKSGYGDDTQGYRREFVRLVETTKNMK
ncbi:TonB-dependent SusC/RagA subfamily outer membrane receptor [Dysgonomonas sp. PH5-45]|uniref:YfbK domain-containing protein n=1 Tax=unclassified Dysgonomonas TaxID=2630389 RepID=UPI002473E262|nr:MULTISPECIES: von Willebrand factor type A domain-containing protein [unclassified Dysgonomonas]MDH6354348.1 TonB-dependent SusC/RagA subfamily outer membrane receptor [Dysgonomonas sp. PH5-45]MDH6387248.1 TonB-dependent SusC/RagA subfamily outer membrane receptor [Dysgonomonas sp. PH5-37]